jgi:hypothetical protein
LHTFLCPAANPATLNLQPQRQRSRLERFHGKKYFYFQNALGYSWRWKFLQRWRCNSTVGLATEKQDTGFPANSFANIIVHCNDHFGDFEHISLKMATSKAMLWFIFVRTW